MLFCSRCWALWRRELFAWARIPASNSAGSCERPQWGSERSRSTHGSTGHHVDFQGDIIWFEDQGEGLSAVTSDPAHCRTVYSSWHLVIGASLALVMFYFPVNNFLFFIGPHIQEQQWFKALCNSFAWSTVLSLSIEHSAVVSVCTPKRSIFLSIQVGRAIWYCPTPLSRCLCNSSPAGVAGSHQQGYIVVETNYKVANAGNGLHRIFSLNEGEGSERHQYVWRAQHSCAQMGIEFLVVHLFGRGHNRSLIGAGSAVHHALLYTWLGKTPCVVAPWHFLKDILIDPNSTLMLPIWCLSTGKHMHACWMVKMEEGSC